MSTTALPPSLQANPLLSQWVRVRPDGQFDICSGKVDIGQGIGHSLRWIAAVALQCPLDHVHLVPASTAHSPDEGMTAGSLSVQHSGTALRHACTHARWLLAQTPHAQAHDWHVPVRVDLLEPDTAAPSHDAPTRDELRALVTGEAFFLSDQLPPGTVHGRVLRPTALRYTLDETVFATLAAKANDPVRLLRDGLLLGLIGPLAEVARLERQVRAQPLWIAQAHDLSATDWADRWPQQTADRQVFHEAGTTPASPGEKTEVFQRRYVKPFLHHASIGPSAACARWHAEGPVRLEVWSHSQGIFALRRDLALAFGLALEDVRVNHARHAGCYGHNGADDVAFDAAWLARHVPDTPVFTQWSRQDEMACAPVGAGMVVDLEVQVDAALVLHDWQHTVYSQGHSSRPGRAATPALLGSFETAVPQPRLEPINMPAAVGAGAERNSITPYRVAHQRVVNHRLLGLPFRTSSLRSLGAQANVFAIESLIDEICHARGLDPLAQRLAWLDDPRGRAVLEQVAASSDWSARRTRLRAEEACGLGVAYSRYKGTGAYCAVVAEVAVAEVVRVRRLWLAADIGQVIHRSGALLQLEGGAIQATSWTLKEAVQWDDTGFTSLDWERYPILRFSELPQIQVDLIDAARQPSLGAGEAAQAPTSAAIANAVFDALGVRVRELPLTPDVIARAM